MHTSNGARFRALTESHTPLPVVGAINAYCAMLAKSAGIQALYLSGAGVANASYGLPDLGMTSAAEVLEDVRRITQAVELPLLVDIDTGWGHAFNIGRTVRLMENAGVAAVHIEDQILAKRCGHRPNKAIVSMREMGDRIKACVDARVNADFVIMARTDAYASLGMNAVIERALYCIELGADMIFPEALLNLNDYQHFCEQVPKPVLANITEFGKTPLFTQDELQKAGVKIVLYPLSAFRAMSQAALNVYQTIMNTGSQQPCIEYMQSREALYQVLDYHAYEQRLDQFRENEHE